MKKALSLVLSLILAAGCLCFSASAGAAATWYVKTGNGGALNVRRLDTGAAIGSLPYGAEVSVESFSGEWAQIVYGSWGSAKVYAAYLVPTDPGKYVRPDSAASADGSLSATTVNGLNRQYTAMKFCTPYSVYVRPDTKTGTARLRWAPSRNAALMAQLPLGYELSVLASNASWMMVQDPVTGQVGYIAAKYTAVR